MLTVLELFPVFIQLCRFLASQEDVFPFLNLNLELEVGFIDQLGSVQRSIDQIRSSEDHWKEMKTSQSDQQDRQQDTAEQRQNLGSQGFLQHRVILMTRGETRHYKA